MKTIPKLRFKEFKGEWLIAQLSDLLEFKNGVNADKEQYGRGIKFINVLDILSNDYLTYDLIMGSVDINEEIFKKNLVSFGDILFQRSSETREEVGTACVYLDDRPATFGGFVIRGKKIGNYNPIFLNKLLKTDLARNAITSKSGGSTRYNVGQETLSSIRLPFPSVPEQQKIASFLSSVDTKIQQLTKKKELLEQYKKGVMQQLFPPAGGQASGKLRFKDENGKAFPKWEEKRLDEVSTFLDGRRKPIKSEDRSKMKGEYPYYGASGVIDYVNEYIFDEDLILLGEDGENIVSRNLPLAFRVSGKCWVNNHAHVIKPNENTDIDFLTNSLERVNYIKYNTGTAQPKLNQEVCKNILLPFPAFKEQQKIASILSALDAKIESVAAQIAHTQTFKKGLLQQMFV